jgi:hypothetical protein
MSNYVIGAIVFGPHFHFLPPKDVSAVKTLSVLSTLCFLLLGSLPAIAGDPLQLAIGSEPQTAPLAPADSYFGRFRMSVLGIRNAIKDVAIRVDSASADELSALYHKLTMVEDAVFDLRERYPHDSWLPQLGFSLAQAFAKMPLPAAQVHANDTFNWLIADYPQSDAASDAGGMRLLRLRTPVSMDVPIEPTLPSYAVPMP